MSTVDAHIGSAPVFIGDDLALDFINSAYGVGDAHRDHFATAGGVSAWLGAAGLLPIDGATVAGMDAIHAAALSLRDQARKLVEQRKRGERGDPVELNRVLALGSAYRELVWAEGKAPVVETRDRADDPRATLLPVAQAIASLLSTADFALIRQCESDDCTLWFHDRTRSHRRRWCSQATCGNRMKVAAFRARKRG